MIEGLTAEQNERIEAARKFYFASAVPGLRAGKSPEALLHSSRKHLQKVMSIIDELAKAKEEAR